MLKNRLSLVLSVLVVAVVPVAAWGAGSSQGTVSITAHVDDFFEWPAAITIAAADFGGNFNGTSQTKTATAAFTCNTNLAALTAVSIQPAAGAHAGVLTDGAAHTLTTSYQLRGDVTVPDAAYKAAGAAGGEFFETPGNAYTVDMTATGAKNFTFMVQAVTPANAANAPSGDYTCTVTLTATW